MELELCAYQFLGWCCFLLLFAVGFMPLLFLLCRCVVVEIVVFVILVLFVCLFAYLFVVCLLCLLLLVVGAGVSVVWSGRWFPTTRGRDSRLVWYDSTCVHMQTHNMKLCWAHFRGHSSCDAEAIISQEATTNERSPVDLLDTRRREREKITKTKKRYENDVMNRC
ncbi:unnamed protein product [Polarella glacialis]|uniref:Uncharacterized protein n=1 Tax=Polarella glacialis TaxID=89957 RepID=A0A813ELV1_POLGL|nr:unnamed protein product [Polarella glacialis]